MEADACVDHAVIDCFEAFEPGRVDLVDRAAHQYQVPHLRTVGDLLQHIFLQPPRIEIGQALVDPDRQYVGHGEDLVPIHIAKMLGLGDATDDGSVRAAGAPEVQQQADADARDHTQFDACKQRNGDRRHVRGEVGLGVVPKLARSFQIHETEDRYDDCGSQGCNRQAVEQRGQEQSRERDTDSGISPGQRRLGPGIEIYD